MIRIATYLSKTFIFTWLTVTFGFLMLIGLLDSLANGSEIMTDGRGFLSTFEYMAYRAPVIFDRVLLFTVVVAILLTYVKLIRQHELVAIIGFGMSAPRQVAMLAPAVIGATAIAVLIINTFTPPAVMALQTWGVGEYKRKAITNDKPLWLQDGNRIIRASGRPSIDTLTDLQFFEQDENGEISAISWIEKAQFDGAAWALSDVTTISTVEDITSPTLEVWQSEHTPTSIAKLAADPRDLSLKDMRLFKQEGNSGSKPSFAYGFWYLHRLTRPLAAFVLLLCAVPLMQKIGREDTGDKALVLGILIGFIYLIIDGALSTFAVSGGLTIGWAIAFPIALFALIGGFLNIKTESLS